VAVAAVARDRNKVGWTAVGLQLYWEEVWQYKLTDDEQIHSERLVMKHTTRKQSGCLPTQVPTQIPAVSESIVQLDKFYAVGFAEGQLVNTPRIKVVYARVSILPVLDPDYQVTYGQRREHHQETTPRACATAKGKP
jgi:hypothetical protein